MRHSFTAEQVDQAIDYLIDEGATDRGQTISYSRLFSAAGLQPPQDLHQGGESALVTDFMAAIHYRCRELGYAPLDALVVHTAGARKGEPGAGYYRVNGLTDPHAPKARTDEVAAALALWERERAECERWGTLVRRGQITLRR